MKRSIIFGAVIFLLGVTRADATVIINEIAWMGTTNSANAEWIELYNNGTDVVILDGWSLKAVDGSPSINLAGQVTAGSYFLLERTSDESVPEIQAGQIYSGSLGNTGEHLELKNNLDELMDQVDSSSGWPAGDNISKQTMQRNGTGWITATGTPGVQNDSGVITNSSTSTAEAPVQNNGTVVVKKEDESADVIPVKADPKYSAKMILPDFATAGTLIPLSVEVKQDGKKNLVDGRFNWYLGDGSSYGYVKNTPFDHVFHYPGDYTVVLEYYSNVFKDQPDSIHKKKISIVPASLTISGITDDGGITFLSDAPKDIDLAQWVLRSRNREYSFPKYTLVLKGKELSVSAKTLSFLIGENDSVELLNPLKVIVSRYPVQNQE